MPDQPDPTDSPSPAPFPWPGQAWVSPRRHQLWRGPVRKKIAPHQPGAGRWAERFGAYLVCVRYRDDLDTQRRVVTVELMVDERPLPTPPAPPPAPAAPPAPAPSEHPAASVGVRIEGWELNQRRQAKQAGARWHPNLGLWLMTRAQAEAAGLSDRITPLPTASDLPQTP
ncbi:hypothetical protein VITFI_CDS3171 [Vitreoscilla filiformis]|uniref:Uncharacterized protein n=1 Tax=Vitreoscilla filiformis TaxID=63 RepID=A0A221KIS1_VITFI|nr:hypothetical protein [Vitreoscilla filiformis]ASM78948.1 hypothetical protein VITFI_CDS3171 [Vitreoscilla filiformis]